MDVMRAKIVNENIRFERGKDPRHQMEIGIVEDIMDKWMVLQQKPGIGSLNIRILEGELYLEIYVSYIPGSVSMGKKAIAETFGNTFFEKIDYHGPYIYCRIADGYEDLFQKAFHKIYESSNSNESHNFKRARDPKSVMGIGHSFQTLSPGMILMAKKDMPRINVKRGDKFEVVESVDMGGSMKRIYYYRLDNSGERIIQTPTEWEIWEEFFDEFLQVVDVIEESYNFERGKDPKGALGLGRMKQIPKLIFEADMDSDYRISSGGRIIDNMYFSFSYSNSWPYLTIKFFTNDIVNTRTGNYAEEEGYNKVDYVEDLLKETGLRGIFSSIGFSRDSRNRVTCSIASGYVGILEEIYGDAGWIGPKDAGLTESVSFERGKDPKETMKIGIDAQMEKKYGNLWKVFKRCNDLSHISENFEWVSEIQFNEDDPYFNIESYFYYTDEEGDKYPIQFVTILYQDYIYIKDVITKEGDDVRSVRAFVNFTEAFEEDQDWEGLFESVSFERGQRPKDSMRIGRVHHIKDILSEMIRDFNEDNREQIISIFYNPPYPSDQRWGEYPSLTIKGDKINEVEFYGKATEYLYAYSMDSYLDLPGQELYGSYSYPVVKCRIKPHSQKYFEGLAIDA